mgnify:CR=1 FL=1
MKKNSAPMAKILKATALVIGCSGIFITGISSAAIEAQVSQSSHDVGAARVMLDSWTGYGPLLNQAKQKLDGVLGGDPQNYLALKEMARYEIMAGLLNSRRVQYGAHYYQVGNYVPGTLEQAEATVRKAIQIKPDFAEGYVLLGHIQTQQTKLAEAEKSLSQAEKLGTNDPWLQINWGSLNDARGEYLTAIDRWQRVLKSGTTNPKALAATYSLLVRCYTRMEDHEKVIALYKDQIKRYPTNAWPRGNLAEYLTSTLDRNDEAIEQASAALKIMNYRFAQKALAWALYRKWAGMVTQGKEAGAEEYFQAALTIDPKLDQVMAYGGSEPAGANLAKALSTKKGVSIDSRAEDGSTALLLATNLNRVKLVQALLDLNANPNVPDRNGWTPLLSAADEGNAEIVSMLLAKGADIWAKKGGWDAAAFAERKGNSELAALLKKRAEDTK